MSLRLGVLHPGAMGSSIAASARRTLGTVYWCSAGRSAATAQRAIDQQLTDIPEFADFCSTCELVIGVCPPHAATAQARALIEAGFKGLYVEANAIAPQTLRHIADELTAAGISCIDGGIIGPPAWQSNTTWLYLSGPNADQVAACFGKGPLQTTILGTEPGQASALKLCYAAWNKGSTALLTAVLATADANGVREALEQQWDVYNQGFSSQSHARIRDVTRKAWRFAGEMEEIASLLDASGVPAGFFTAAADLYKRQSIFKDIAEPPPIDSILQLVRTIKNER